MDNSKKEELSKYDYLLAKFFTLQIKYVIIILLLLSALCFFLSWVLTYNSFWGGIFYTIGITLIIALVLNTTYELAIKKKSEHNLLTSVETVCGEKFKDIPNEISKAIILESSVQMSEKDKKIDEIVLSGLKSKLGENIGREVFEGPLQAITESAQKEIRHDMVGNVKLKQLRGEIGENFDRIVIEYHYKTTLKKQKFKFACTTNIHLFYEYTGVYEDIFYSSSLKKYGFNITNEIYDIKEVRVDELKLERKETNKGEDFYEIEYSHAKLQNKINKEVLIYYVIETVLSREGNYYFIDIVYPTKTVTLTFSSDIDLSYIDPCAFFVSLKEPAIRGYERDEDENKNKDVSAQISLNDWVFPYSGVIFIWSRKKPESKQ